MNILRRLIARIRFRRSIKGDESTNVVDGMVKARRLYRELCILAHPDKHPSQRDEAEKLMMLLTANKYNYAALVKLEKEIKETLNKD